MAVEAPTPEVLRLLRSRVVRVLDWDTGVVRETCWKVVWTGRAIVRWMVGEHEWRMVRIFQFHMGGGGRHVSGGRTPVVR